MYCKRYKDTTKFDLRVTTKELLYHRTNVEGRHLLQGQGSYSLKVLKNNKEIHFLTGKKFTMATNVDTKGKVIKFPK